jgi:Zn-dependent protease with chaperone function
MAAVTLAEISSSSWEHPGDRAALAALRAIPGLDSVMRAIIGRFGETNIRMMMQANAIKTSETQYPDIHRALRDTCEVLDWPVPELYVSQSPIVNAGALGVDEPFIVLQSSLVEVLDEGGLHAVIGHEVGHIISEHALYRTVLNLLLSLSRAASPLISSAMIPIMLALLEWNRKSELSCDRAGLLAVQDLDVSLGALAAMAGGIRGRNDKINLDDFVAQSDAYLDTDGMASFYKITAMLQRPHPFVMSRVAELRNWVTDGTYHAILEGDYTRRGDEDSVATEAREAGEYYSEHATEVFENTEDKLIRTLRGFVDRLDSAVDALSGSAGSGSGSASDDSDDSAPVA